MKIRPLIGRLIRIGGRSHVNQPLLNFSERLRRSIWKRIREQEEKQNLILIPRKDSTQSTVEWMPPPPLPTNLCSVKQSENCREILLINFMGFQDKDFNHQKLMRVLLLMRSPFSTDPDLIHALLSCASNIHLHVSHGNHLQGIPMGSKCEYFCTGKWESPAKHLWFWRKWQIWADQQEQCIVWIPLQCEIPMAKRANSYSGAMVMTCKTGESPIVSQLSKCLKFMTFLEGVLKHAVECKYLSEAFQTFYHH